MGAGPAPLTLTLSQYAGQILGQSATAAATAHDDSQFQTGVQSEISTRAQSVSAVNLDQELANLSIYQTAYSASARVVQTVVRDRQLPSDLWAGERVPSPMDGSS